MSFKQNGADQKIWIYLKNNFSYYILSWHCKCIIKHFEFNRLTPDFFAQEVIIQTKSLGITVERDVFGSIAIKSYRGYLL